MKGVKSSSNRIINRLRAGFETINIAKIQRKVFSMSRLNLLLVDNYDSFTYNLQHMLLMFPGVELKVKRNDDDLIAAMQQDQYDGVIIGPGPGSPEDDSYFGFNKQIILEYGTSGLPVLGVCLGFQGIYHSFGGSLKISALPMHGKTSLLSVTDKSSTLLQGIADHAEVMRYHSIVADLSKPIPDCLNLVAYAAESDTQSESDTPELMAIEHKVHPIYGVQFHPESFATECGIKIIENFVRICR